MKVVCYCPAADKHFRDKWGKMRIKHPELGLELHRSLDGFASRLRQPGGNIAVVMLYIVDKATLSDLLDMSSLWNGLPIIILLNDQEPEILRFSHELRPRVIMYSCWTAEDICSVLQRCMDRYGNREVATAATASNAQSTVVNGLEKEKGRGTQILTAKEIAGVLQEFRQPSEYGSHPGDGQAGGGR